MQKCHNDVMAYNIFKLASIIFITISGIITIIPFMNLLKSTNLERDARDYIFFAHLGYICLLSPYISLILWIHGILESNNFYFAASFGEDAPLPYILVMYLLITLTLLFPYVIGETRNKKWTESLLEKRISWLNRLLDVLDYPEPEIYVNRLTNGSRDISKEIEIYEKENPGEFDPRRNYIDFLKNLNDKVELLLRKFSGAEMNEMTRIAGLYSEKIRSRKGEVSIALDNEKKAKSHFYIYASLFISTVLIAIINQLIKIVSSALQFDL
jgi:hypothetical protein